MYKLDRANILAKEKIYIEEDAGTQTEPVHKIGLKFKEVYRTFS